jgi:lysophospholipase L1-like esterase
MMVSLALGIGEIVARCLPRQSMIRFQQVRERLAGGDREQFLDLIEDDPETFWRLKPSVKLPDDTWPFFGLVSNAQHLRDERHFGPKAAKDIRILFLGDSCTYGYGLSHLETISHYVEQRLAQSFPNSLVTCINAGVPGYTLFQGQQQLYQFGYGLEPDVVVVSFGWNDGDSWDGRTDLQQHETLRSIQPAAWLRWSRLGHLASAAFNSRPTVHSKERWTTRLPPREYFSILEELQTDTHQKQIELLLLVPGSRGTVVEPAREKHAGLNLYQSEGIRFGRSKSFGPYNASGYIDGVAILNRMLELHTIDDLFIDSVHPTAVANKALAYSVAHTLIPWLREELQ